MEVKHIIFDLDDTLYPCTSEMNKSISRNMVQFVADFFHLSYDEAVTYRKTHIKGHASTLEWLMSEGLTDAESYFVAVHPENEAEGLQKAPELRPLLQSLGVPITVLTNAPSEHAERVLSYLGVRDLFTAITDIRDCKLRGKPYPGSFEIALQRAGGTVADTLFVDDQKKYTAGYENIGGTAIQVGTGAGSYQLGLLPDASQIKMVDGGRTIHADSIYDLPTLIPTL